MNGKSAVEKESVRKVVVAYSGGLDTSIILSFMGKRKL
jgi:argininosuccinate synthase